MTFSLDQASTWAERWQVLFFVSTGVIGAAVVAVFVLLVVFTIRYRASSNASRAGRIDNSRTIEIAWIATPLALFLVLFAFVVQMEIVRNRPPADALEIQVVGKQWMWKIQHPSGVREINALHIPVNRPVKLSLTSQDVIHSFYVPAFRLKQDALPGRYTVMWFEATDTGTFRLQCAEYCGTEHSLMDGEVVVMTPEDYSDWLKAQRPSESLIAQGERLFNGLGCSGCHTARSAVHAPQFEGAFGRPVPLSDGTTVLFDEAYARDSILFPERQVVAGFRPIMPSFRGLIGEEDLLKIISYIRSLADEEVDAP